jgi:hypothetical protein
MVPPAYPPPPTVDAAESSKHRSPTQLSMSEEPSAGMRQTFAYHKTILQVEPGRLQLRLRTTPQITVDPSTMNCEVVGWGLRLPARDAEHLPKAMARRFLELFSKADSGRLDEQEQQYWLDVLDQVDFQTFCIDRAAPHYMEGVVVTQQPSFTLVEWHDGTREKLDQRTARPLGNLERDDEFGAWVKLGRDNKAMQMENVMLLPSGTL